MTPTTFGWGPKCFDLWFFVTPGTPNVEGVLFLLGNSGIRSVGILAMTFEAALGLLRSLGRVMADSAFQCFLMLLVWECNCRFFCLYLVNNDNLGPAGMCNSQHCPKGGGQEKRGQKYYKFSVHPCPPHDYDFHLEQCY